MFVKLAFSLLLTASVACFGQVTVTGGYATTSGPATMTIPGSAANPPLVSTPDIALPGSGPAVGVRLSNTNPNDSRDSTGPSVANSNSITLPTENGNTATETPLAPSSAAPSENSGPFEFGIQRFGMESVPAKNAISLGEIAKRYRAQHHQGVRTFTNDSIARLIAVAFQLGPLGAATQNQIASNLSRSGSSGDAATSTMAAPTPSVDQLIAEDRAPELPQSDQDIAHPQVVEAALRADATDAQQRNADDDQAVSDTTPAAAQAASVGVGNSAVPRQTHYSLPLFLLLGGIGVAVRGLFLILR